MATSQPLPQGWRIAGLYVHGAGTFKVDPGKRVTDSDIERSDAVIVAYTSRRTGTTVHRTIHGAQSKQGVGDIIRFTTRVVSPIR